MESDKATARAAGALLLIALLTNAVGSEMAEAVLLAPDYLTGISASRSSLMTGEVLELICGAAVIGFGVVMFPALRRHNHRAALGYLGFRITEAAVNIAIVLSSLALFTLSQEYLKAPTRDTSYFHTLGALLQAERFWAQSVYIIVFGFGAVILYCLLFSSRLVPRFISVWGLGGLAVLLAGCLLGLYGRAIDMAIYGIPLGLNELVLGVWLMVRGFSPTAAAVPVGAASARR